MSWRQKAKAENKCVNCGVPKTRTGVHCADCAKNHRERAKKYIKEVRRGVLSGKCHYCGKTSEKRQCPECKSKLSQYQKGRRLVFKEQGTCTSCGDPRVEESSSCLRHYMEGQSGSAFGTTKRWKEILASFESQNGICYYSGIKLIIGKNASLDHKIPKSKHGIEDGVYDAGNLVWCDKMVNIMKNSMTDDEFIAMCKKITDYCQSEPAEPRRLRRTKKQELLGLITI